MNYVVGDASAAYTDPDLTRFVRHVFWQRPGLMVLLDDLDARRPAVFDWLLHTEGRVTQTGATTLLVRQGRAAMRIQVVWPREIALAVETGPNPHADPQWGVREWTTIRVTPKVPLVWERFLAVLALAHGDEAPAEPAVFEDAAGATIRPAAGPVVRAQIRPKALVRPAAGQASP